MFWQELLHYEPGQFHAFFSFRLRLFARYLEECAHPQLSVRLFMGRVESPPVVVAQR
ncbi:hypothetical protein [Mumia zhuanghuii]|uniref:hypothetical protein n=1 Tax=Mumia zhuanghuii TaxID=2585211 RepID=UPI00129C7ACA|nr:hypothetical protein [Mumia zhuanghuii]